ncbi:MAG: BrnA antitoxin family protein [Gemmatimonadales bacterium]
MPKSKRALKPIPAFSAEDDEREFWAEHDSTDYVDWSQARVVRFPNLRPSSTAISVRLPDTLLTELKLLANERDVPYQSLLKVYLTDRVTAERHRAHGARRPNKRLQPSKARRPRSKKASRR